MIGMFLGFAIGAILHQFQETPFIHEYITTGILDLIGRIFIISMKMLVVPLVFVSIVCGACNLSDPKTLGRVGGKTIALYLVTTCIAITLAICFALLFHLGQGADLQTGDINFIPKSPSTLTETIINLFPSNPIDALAEGKILQVIIFALLFGFAISISGESGIRIRTWFNDINQVIMSLVNIILLIAPIGVFALITKLMITTEPAQILHIFGYFGTVLLVLIVHLLVTNSILLAGIARLSPIPFFKKMFPTMLFAFSTSSSNATIPLTLKTVKNDIGVDNKVCGFTIPLGATINMDGTAIMQGVATIFIANLYNIDIGLTGYLMVIITATLSSIGTAGVPGIGLITLTMVLQQVGLPVEGIALIIGVDRILDMVRTAVNVTGDAAVTTVVAKSEGLLDIRQYQGQKIS